MNLFTVDIAHRHPLELKALRQIASPAAASGNVMGVTAILQPEAEWPGWAAAIRAQAAPDERNLTETIERLVGPFGSDAFKLWHSEQFGALTPHCNCAALKWQWATQFDYSKPLTNPTD